MKCVQIAARDGLLGSAIQDVVIEDFSPWETKRSTRAWDNVHQTARSHHIGAPWPDTRDLLKAQMSHWALALSGEFRAFTLNISSDVEMQAVMKARGATRWFSQRFNRFLQSPLGRNALYWFRIELKSDGKPYLHLHGELACTEPQLPAIRAALRKVGGPWAGAPNKQVYIPLQPPDVGWVSYVMKVDPQHAAQRVLSARGTSYPPSWRDDRFFISANLSRDAKFLYEEVRPKIKIKTISIEKHRSAKGELAA